MEDNVERGRDRRTRIIWAIRRVHCLGKKPDDALKLVQEVLELELKILICGTCINETPTTEVEGAADADIDRIKKYRVCSDCLYADRAQRCHVSLKADVLINHRMKALIRKQMESAVERIGTNVKKIADVKNEIVTKKKKVQQKLQALTVIEDAKNFDEISERKDADEQRFFEARTKRMEKTTETKTRAAGQTFDSTRLVLTMKSNSKADKPGVRRQRNSSTSCLGASEELLRESIRYAVESEPYSIWTNQDTWDEANRLATALHKKPQTVRKAIYNRRHFINKKIEAALIKYEVLDKDSPVIHQIAEIVKTITFNVINFLEAHRDKISAEIKSKQSAQQ
ncbi:unnamed protein product [Caenorhabditis sp. 36 PRJEB53466]|nr:unnamed protein product [Caenorhabditis sp. 36 PRJEB53466]